MKRLLLLTATLSLLACKGPAPKDTTPDIKTVTVSKTMELPLRKHFACLPKEAAIVAAHRGTSKKESLPENSRLSLTTLISNGIMVAEVDVVGLKDGTHVLFHDGVWEDKTTGSGPVASTNWEDAQEFLLLDTDGEFSADRLITLTDALELAKDKIYLEIDFKSSAKYQKVINMVRDNDMASQVILIAYNERQAKRLAELAPEMLLSVGAKSVADLEALEAVGVKRQNMAIWMGRGPYDPDFVSYLDAQNIPILAWPNEGRARQDVFGPAVLAVSDYALQKEPIEGLSAEGRAEYEACLSK